MPTQIEGAIREIVCRELECDSEQLTPQTDIRELPGVESIRILRVVMHIEAYYDIELEDEAVFQIRNLADLAGLVEAEVGRHAVSSSAAGVARI